MPIFRPTHDFVYRNAQYGKGGNYAVGDADLPELEAAEALSAQIAGEAPADAAEGADVSEDAAEGAPANETATGEPDEPEATPV